MKPPLRLIRGGGESAEERAVGELLRTLPSQTAEDVSVERVWRKVSAPAPRSFGWLWMPVAALAVVVVAILLHGLGMAESPRLEIVLRSGNLTLVRLPGVATMLVRDGELQPVADSHGTHLRLMGGTVTAKVSKRSPEEPFVIHAGSTAVRVVGTLFTVELDRGVSVHEGTVEVTDKTGAKTLVTAGHRWSPEGADATSESVVQLLEAALRGESAEQVRDRFLAIDRLAVSPPPVGRPREATPLVQRLAPKPVVVHPQVKPLPETTPYERAVTLETQGDFSGAAEALETAINREPQRSELLVRLGRLEMQRLNDPVAALVAFQRYRRQFPQGPLMEVVDLSVLEIRIGQGDGEQTLQELGRFIDRHPTSERIDEMRMRRGALLAERGDWGSALADYRSVQSAGQQEEAMFLTAACQQHMGEADGALRTLRAYLKRFPHGRHSDEARQVVGPGEP